MKTFIINGLAKSGKDTFVELIKNYLDIEVYNISSVDDIKEAAKILGWSGSKTDKSRKFLSELKKLSIDYNDHPVHSIVDKINEYKINNGHENFVNFIHIREPEEIIKLKKLIKIDAVIFIDRDVDIPDNDSDGSVYDYEYDLFIDNNSDLTSLGESAKVFCKNFKLVE